MRTARTKTAKYICGEWMRNWEKDCDDAGINLVCDSITCQEAPNDDTLEACRAMGKQLAG